MTRVLCLQLPDWPIQRLQAEQATVLATGTPRLVHRRDSRRGECVSACCAVARQAGVRSGMPLSEALALVRATAPLVWPADPAADVAALRRLAEDCEQFSPVVGWPADTAPDDGADNPGNSRAWAARDASVERLLLDVTGIGPLFGGERSLLHAVHAACHQAGYVVTVAIADTVGAAWALTAAGLADQIVPPGGSAAVLAALPVATLRLPESLIDVLRQLGVLRIEQLTRLPRASLAARFDPILLTRLDQALGLTAELIQPYRPPPRFQADWRLDEPTDDQHWLGDILRNLLARIAAELAPHNQGIVQLVVRLDVVGGRPLLMRLELVRPSAAPRHWEELIRLRWERLDQGGPVGRLTVQATQTAPLEQRQRELFPLLPGSDPQAWETLLERLAGRLGSEAVLGVELRRQGLPEQDFVYRPWVRTRRTPRPPPAQRRRGAPRQTAAAADAEPNDFPRAAPAYRPLSVEPVPHRLEVLAVAPFGPPVSFCWKRTWRRVARWWGPERLETGWWHGPSRRRDYYRLETTTGDRWWLYRDLTSGDWFLHGSFD